MPIEKFVQAADGTELYTSRVGEGPPLMLCDGLGCDGFIWKHIIPYFQDRYSILRWHYRGHGLSQPPPSFAALRVSDFMGDILAVLDAHQMERAVLFGHSMGVQLVLEFAVEHPERVAGLVPVCGSYGRPLETFHDNSGADLVFPYLLGLVRAFPSRAQMFWTRFLRSEVAYQMGLRTEVNPSLVQREDFAPYFDHLASMDVQLFMAVLERINGHTVEDRLQDIQAPMLAVAGEKDGFTPAWLTERMVELVPNAELLMVPGATHVAPIEIPELVHLRIERFLEQLWANATPTKPRRKNARKKASPKNTKASQVAQDA